MSTEEVSYKTYEEDPGNLVGDQCTDAMAWARSFVATKEKNDWGIDDIDEGLMLAWFASAIETTKDAGW